MKQELTSMYHSNEGLLPMSSIAGLVWDLVTDTWPFFHIFPTEEELLAINNEGMPASNISVWRTFLPTNLYLPSLNTPS